MTKSRFHFIKPLMNKKTGLWLIFRHENLLFKEVANLIIASILSVIALHILIFEDPYSPRYLTQDNWNGRPRLTGGQYYLCFEICAKLKEWSWTVRFNCTQSDNLRGCEFNIWCLYHAFTSQVHFIVFFLYLSFFFFFFFLISATAHKHMHILNFSF